MDLARVTALDMGIAVWTGFTESTGRYIDPTALAGCPQASLLPSNVLAGQRRD